MTGNEFKKARIARLKVSQANLSVLMKTPKRTIQDIEALADQPVRGVYEVCIELLIQRDQWITQAVIEKVQFDISCNYPNGIRSAIDSDFNEG